MVTSPNGRCDHSCFEYARFMKKRVSDQCVSLIAACIAAAKSRKRTVFLYCFVKQNVAFFV